MFAAGGLNRDDFIFRKRKGEVLCKKPGSINGQAFVLEDLEDCTVYLLDWTSQVQIDDCVNCKLFIGPVDGSAFFRDCTNCQLSIACRQFRTRDCKKLDVSLYCNSNPSIETTCEMQLSCWMGAYPKLTEHFTAAKLDPTENNWREVYDFNTDDAAFNTENGEQHWHFHPSPPTEFWEVPLDNFGPCENPVLTADGGGYVPTAAGASGAGGEGMSGVDAPATPAHEEEPQGEESYKSRAAKHMALSAMMGGGGGFGSSSAAEPAAAAAAVEEELVDGSAGNPLFAGPPQGGDLSPAGSPAAPAAPPAAADGGFGDFGDAPDAPPAPMDGGGMGGFGEPAPTDAFGGGGMPADDAGMFGAAPEADAGMFGGAPEGDAGMFGAAPEADAGMFGGAPAGDDGFGAFGGEPQQPQQQQDRGFDASAFGAPAPPAHEPPPPGLSDDFGEEGFARANEISRERIDRKLREEQEAKTLHASESSAFMESFYNERSTNMDRRQGDNRTAEGLLAAQQQSGTAPGGNIWESIAALIDFSFERPNGVDLARYKSVLFALKNRPDAPGAAA